MKEPDPLGQQIDYGMIVRRDRGRPASETEIVRMLQRYPTELSFIARPEGDSIAYYWRDDEGNVRKAVAVGEKLA